ncbi:MAG: anthranilate synthase component I family protein, partial [Flavobacteriaceae bacterium]|nr:anthranilate synthase component I family protein [Flavobacteriaceae bacterium]
MYQLKTHYKKIIADTITPVSIYLKVRDQYPNSILLENSDYRATDNSFSYVCSNPIASIKVADEVVTQKFPDGTVVQTTIDKQTNVPEIFDLFSRKFSVDLEEKFKFISNGIFGYTAYDAVRYFEDIEISKKDSSLGIPDMYYAVYQNIIAISNFENVAYIFSNSYDESNNIEAIHQLLKAKNYATFDFLTDGEIISNLSDDQYKEQVKLAKKHCARGDVFQLVLSKKFSQNFKGDEFNVYRALRTINPSPYLFFFDFGDFKIFGSSPEAQLVVKDGQAEIHPIAGTFKRSGDDLKDAELARQLAADEKENAEHVMLVDLARNDLS